MFKERFLQRLPADFRDTDMANVLSYIGSVMETELINEIRAMVLKNVDVSYMTEEELKKYLAFHYIPVRNFQQSSGLLKISNIETKSSYFLPARSVVETKKGIPFYTENGVSLMNGVDTYVIIKQGKFKNVTGVYQGWIQLNEIGVDLKTVRLFLNEQEIPKRDRPFDGFMVFYFKGIMYVKVYGGLTVDNLVPQIENSNYRLEYVVCDGQKGNLEIGDIASFSDVLLDNQGNPIKYTLSVVDSEGNLARITNGADAPPLYELRDLYNYWYYTKNVVSKISDYKNWFLSQAEVGDCIVLGDYERWLELGDEKRVTGLVYVCVCSKNLEILDGSVLADLDNRLSKVKDIAIISYQNFELTKFAFTVEFYTSKDNGAFSSWIRASLMKLFDLEYVRNHNSSLFEGFDLYSDLETLGIDEWLVQGLNIIPYYFFELEILNGTSNFTIDKFYRRNSVKMGYTFYTFYEYDNIENKNIIKQESFFEVKDSSNPSGLIYDIYRKKDGGEWERIGFNDYGDAKITFLKNFEVDGKLEIKTEVLNRSFIRPRNTFIKEDGDLIFFLRSFAKVDINIFNP